MNVITKGQLISDARTIARELNGDSKLSNKALWSIISKHADWLIHRDSNKLKLAKFDYLYQTLKCVRVDEAPVIDPCCGVKSKCMVFRTVDKLPELYEDSYGVRIRSVFSIDGSAEFTQISVQDYMRKVEDPNMRYDKSRYFFFNNGYLYFPKNPVRMVMVKGHYKNDVTADCGCGEDKPCVQRISEGSMLPDYLRGELMEFVKKDLLQMKQIRPDEQIDKNQNRIS